MMWRIRCIVIVIAVCSGCGVPLGSDRPVDKASVDHDAADCANPKWHRGWPITQVKYRRTLSSSADNVTWDFYGCGTAITRRSGHLVWTDYSEACSSLREWLCFKQSNRNPDSQGLFVTMPKGYRSGVATWLVDGVEFKAEPLGAGSGAQQVVRILARRVSGSEHPASQSFIYTFESGILEAIVETDNSESKQIYVVSQKYGIFAQGSEY